MIYNHNDILKNWVNLPLNHYEYEYWYYRNIHHFSYPDNQFEACLFKIIQIQQGKPMGLQFLFLFSNISCLKKDGIICLALI